jgi:hypothetical protein
MSIVLCHYSFNNRREVLSFAVEGLVHGVISVLASQLH